MRRETLAAPVPQREDDDADPSAMSDEEFSVALARRPFSSLRSFSTLERWTLRDAVRVAALHLSLTNTLEAFEISDRILRGTQSIPPSIAVRALTIRGVTGSAVTLSDRYRNDFIEAHRILGHEEVDQAGDLLVALLINWAGAQSMAGQVSAAIQTLGNAEVTARALPGPYPLRVVRLRTIEFNQVSLEMPGHDALLHLGGRVDAFEADGALPLAARIHFDLASLLAIRDLDTGGIHHAYHAIRLFLAADQPDQATKANIRLARMLDGLGFFDQAGQILNDASTSSGSSGGRFAQAGRLNAMATALERLAEYDQAFAALDQAYDLVESVVLRAPGLFVSEESVNDLITAGILLSRKIRAAAELEKWKARAEACARLLSSVDRGVPHALILRWNLASLLGNEEDAHTLIAAIAEASTASSIPNALEKVSEISNLDAPYREMLHAYLGDDGTPISDVAEYWGHVRQLTNEDDEAVRAAYRRANVLPVLHRMLRKGQLQPLGQFEAVELSRWGSLAGGLGSVSFDEDAAHGLAPFVFADAKALRLSFLRRSAGLGASYPAALGAPRSIGWGKWKGGILDDPAASSWRPPTVDLRALILDGDWPADPELLQIYVRGNEVYWVQLDTRADAAARGQVTLSTIDLELLQRAGMWSSPAPTAFDHEVVTRLGLDVSLLPAVAGVRCCLGPYVNDLELARDFAVGLPAIAQAGLASVVADELRQCPSLKDLHLALGRLFPANLWREEDRPLILTVPWELSQLPLMLATNEAGDEICSKRLVSLLPPVNTLAAMHRQTANSSWPAWKLSMSGESAADLLRSEPTETRSLADAFMRSPEDTADGHAVLYRGHYDASDGPPSAAGLGIAGSDRLLTAAEILASSTISPARIGLMCCRGAGLHFTDEWGGIASALMVKGAREIVAPGWPIIDSVCATELDDAVAELLVTPGHLSVHFARVTRGFLDDYKRNISSSVPPHWWSGYYLLRG